MSARDVEGAKQFHTNDMVYRFDRKHKKIVFGIVTDSDDCEATDITESPLQPGEIMVLWSNKTEAQIWKHSRVKLMARSIMLGEIVRRFEKGKETQRGYCKDVKRSVTVRIIGTDKIVENVAGSRLKRVSQFDIEDAVCLDNKYGRIENIDQRITMASKCGSVVEILTSINHEIDDFWSMNRSKGIYEPFYPGQEVVCVPKDLEQPLWLKKSKTIRRNPRIRRRFTVQTVEDCMMEIAWVGCDESSKTICEMSLEEIKNLKVVQHEFEYLDNRQMLKINTSDVLLNKKDWMKKLLLMYKRESRIRLSHNLRNFSKSEKIPSENCEDEDLSDNWCTDDEENGEFYDTSSVIESGSKTKHYPPGCDELVPGNTLPVEIICAEALATVVWQDGTVEHNIPTTNLVYSVSLDEHEFFPGDWVTPSDKNGVDKDNSYSYGVVKFVNYLERTATVKWFNYDEKQVEIATNEKSVYDLKKHTNFLFRPATVVRAKPLQMNKMGSVIESSPEGWVQVKWIDGTEESCCVENLEIIPDSSEYELSEDDDSEGREPVSWETESIESYAGDNTADTTTLQSVASRLEFIRNRIIYFKEAFKRHTFQENLNFLKDLLTLYDNSSYLDKLLGTSFFSLKSKHFQLILTQAKERAKAAGVEFRGRLFTNETPHPSTIKLKVAEKDNISKVLKLENKVNAQIENNKEEKAANSEMTSPDNPEPSQENLCIELLSMIKLRMDLAYAELISKIGGPQALTIMTQASENIAIYPTSTPLPSLPTTPDESVSSLNAPKFQPINSENHAYLFMDEAPLTHHYYGSKFETTDIQRFMKAVQREYQLLAESLPAGVWVRCYTNRIDLMSVMIEGPSNTPYEDGLFVFDIQMSSDYPRSPPLVHYVSYSTESLNPNLYVEGKVCVSLLGTWMGRGTETWGTNSTLLQLIVSIQGLILVAEPYYNEAGYEKQTHTQQGRENSRTYNELVILKLVQSMSEMLKSPPEVFKQEVYAHFAEKGEKMCARLRSFCQDEPPKPDFSLLPVSRGLKLSLTAALQYFEEVLKNIVNEKE